MFVYVICNEDGDIYIGQTRDMERRLKEHRRGKTKTINWLKNQKWRILHKWAVVDEATALLFEMYLHDKTRQEVLDIILDLPIMCPTLANDFKNFVFRGQGLKSLKRAPK